PVELGFATSLNRPGGNLTGGTTLNVEIGPKRLEGLPELVPAATVVGARGNPANHSAVIRCDMGGVQGEAATHGWKSLHSRQGCPERDLDDGFSTLTQRRAGGLVISPDTFFSGQSDQLAVLALRHALPTISPYREFVTAGGLMSYGGSITDQYRLVGNY